MLLKRTYDAVYQYFVYFYKLSQLPLRKRIFCLSFQKTGTTSTGHFFKHLGFPTAQWHISDQNNWTEQWFNGNYEAIFSSNAFKTNQVFEDNPWWFPEFYKVLFQRFPDSKFILFTRNSDDWFRSMSLSYHGNTRKIQKIHAKLYRREEEFYRKADSFTGSTHKEMDWQKIMGMEGMDNHYKSIYERRNREVIEFFNKHSPESLWVCSLDDPQKWEKLGVFVGIDIPAGFEVHANKTIVKEN